MYWKIKSKFVNFVMLGMHREGIFWVLDLNWVWMLSSITIPHAVAKCGIIPTEELFLFTKILAVCSSFNTCIESLWIVCH
jgi:hypothetical protein